MSSRTKPQAEFTAFLMSDLVPWAAPMLDPLGLTLPCLRKQASTAKTGDYKHPILIGTLQVHESLATQHIIIPDNAIGCHKI